MKIEEEQENLKKLEKELADAEERLEQIEREQKELT